MLSPRDRQIVRLQARGFDIRSTASRIKISPATVRRVMALPAAQTLFDQLRANLDENGEDAVGVLTELLSSHSENVRLAAARALLSIPLADEVDDPDDPENLRPHIQVTQRAGRS